MPRAERVHDPDSLLAMRDKRTYADDRMINVLRKLIADRFQNFGVRLATAITWLFMRWSLAQDARREKDAFR